MRWLRKQWRYTPESFVYWPSLVAAGFIGEARGWVAFVVACLLVLILTLSFGVTVRIITRRFRWRRIMDEAITTHAKYALFVDGVLVKVTPPRPLRLYL